MTDVRVAISTAGSQEEAQRLARVLVEERLAACVNIVPGVESVYRWQDKVESAVEWLLVIKTTTARLEEAGGRLRELHSYDVPEFVVLPVVDGSAEYLEWVRGNAAASAE